MNGPWRKVWRVLAAVLGLVLVSLLFARDAGAQAPPPVPGQPQELVLASPTPGPVPQSLTFSANPTVQEITSARVFEEPLVPMGGNPTPEENRALANALIAFSQRPKPDDFSALTAFLESPVSYHWYPAVAFCLGWEYYNTGYYSKAIQTWEDAWWWSKDATESKARPLADRTVGELTRMYSRVGETERVEELLTEIKGRSLSGSAPALIAAARQALWLMKNKPAISFRCGQLALNNVANFLRGYPTVDKLVFDSASTTKGFSLGQVHKLSQDLKLGLQMAQRQRGARVVLPCVIHWNVSHYAALMKQEGDRFLAVDPTFGKSIWISQDVLESEASGYFLIPEGTLPAGWRAVGGSEARSVWGKGVTTSSDPNSTTPSDMKADPDCPGVGMAAYNFHLMLVSLNVEDTPISFQPPRGPRVEFTVTYNQREANQPANFSYSNFGQNWNCNWISYVRDNGPDTPADVEHYVAGGGTETYTGFDTNSQAFTPNWRTQAVLKRTSTNSYELTYPDGARLMFTNTDGTVGNTRKIFVSQVVDSTGYTNQINYDSALRLANVIDPVANVTNLLFYYNTSVLSGSTNTIQKVKDRYGREATFGYGDSLLFQLHSITDVINLTSSVTYSGTFINKLTTPYGTTTFNYGEDGRTRWLEATDPQHNKSRVEYTERTDIGIPSSEPGTLVPQGMFTRNYILHGRNTFYWDKKAMREAPGDYSKARLYHWLHDRNLASAVGVLESYKEPLENRVWFNYAGQGDEFSATVQGFLNLPERVGRVLDDGVSQIWRYYRNSVGKITNSIDPTGRNFSYVYATNGIDLLEVRQTRGSNNELLAAVSYNSQHLPLTVTNASGNVTGFGYNIYGQVTSITNALNEVTAFNYDSGGHLLAIDGALAGTNDTVSFTYDSYDRVYTITDVSGYTVTNSYDKLDRPTTNAYPDGSTEVITYKYLDPETFTDREGRVTQVVFDALRQLREIREATNWITRLDWCACGNLESLTDPLGRRTVWYYDIQGRPTIKQYPDHSLEQYAYEQTTSRLKSVTNERGQTRTYAHGNADSLLQITYSDTNVTPNVTYFYDTNYYRLTAMTDGTGTTLFDYHPVTSSPPTLGAGRLKSVNGPLAEDTIQFSYDELERLKSEHIYNSILQQQSPLNPFSGKFYHSQWAYDALGRVAQVTNTLGQPVGLGAFTYGYHGASTRLASINYPNAYSASFTYHGATNDFRVKDMDYASTGTKFTYDYSPAGRITNWVQQIASGAQQHFRLKQDPIDQLTNVTVVVGGATNKTYAYTYDPAGNRTQEKIDTTTVSAWFNPLNQLIGKDAGTTATNRQYEWDEENRLRAIVEGNNRTEFLYNGVSQVGRIIEKTGSTTNLNRYLTWSGGRLAEERNNGSSGEFYKWYYEEGYFDYYWANQGGTFYFMRDHLGSVWEVRRAYDGLLARQSAYDPYGRRTAAVDLFGAYSIPPHDGPEMGFTGLFTLNAQGLVMAAHRVYDPDLGRWISRDPIGEAGGLNLYRYANNDPVNWIDPDGLCAVRGQGPGSPLNSLGGGGGIRPPRPPRVANAAGASGDAGGGGPLRPNGAKGGKPFVPDVAWTKNAPKQVAPGTKTLEHTKFNPKTGEWEKSTVRYDQYGRQTGRTDNTTHGRPDAHPNPHHHTTEYGPGFAPGGKESGVLPGPLP